MASNSVSGDGERWHVWRIAGWGGAVALLMAPFVAMRFTSEVNWTAEDFIVAGLLIGGVGLAFEFAVRRSANAPYRAGAAIALLAAFLLTWANLAVGIAGNEDNPVNLSFFMLVLMAAVGAFAAKYRAGGVARTMFGVAAIQLILGAIVSTGPVGAQEPVGPLGLFAINGIFAILWLASGILFKRAGEAG